MKIEESDKIKTTLRTNTLSDYSQLSKELGEWLDVTEKTPDIFWQRIRNIPRAENIKVTLSTIREELLSLYNGKKDEAKSFEDSRFTPINKMIERGMISCGAMTKIVGTALRELGIPTKWIHGSFYVKPKTSKDRVIYKHAWLELYIPRQGAWISIDPARADFSVTENHKKIKEYHNWEELKEDYKSNKF